MGQWLRLHTPNVGGLGSIPSQGTGSYMLQLRSKIPRATAKNQHSRTNKYICKERKKKQLGGKNNYEGKLNLDRKIIYNTYYIIYILFGLPWWFSCRESICNAGETWQESRVRSVDWEDPVEKEMATHASILAWEILWAEEPGGQGSQSQT